MNSHDKSSAYQLHCGLFRLVCTNGTVVSDGTFQRISIKHSGFNPDSVIEASLKVLTAVFRTIALRYGNIPRKGGLGASVTRNREMLKLAFGY